MKKLYRLDVEPESFEMYVWADDEAEASKIAINNASSELDNVGTDFHVGSAREVKGPGEVEDHWLDALPYGENNLSIQELLEKVGE